MSKSSIITSDGTSADLLSPVTPGELLKEEFLVPMGISQYRLAKETGIPAQRIGQIVLGKRRVTADTDLRLCRYFGLTVVVLKDIEVGVTMERRRQTAVYSPGGCGCGLLLIPVIVVSVGLMFVLAELAAAAFVLLIVAIGVTIWLCRNREQRRADGKTNVGWTIFLVVAYLLSISYLAFFILLLVSTFTGESVTVG